MAPQTSKGKGKGKGKGALGLNSGAPRSRSACRWRSSENDSLIGSKLIPERAARACSFGREQDFSPDAETAGLPPVFLTS